MDAYTIEPEARSLFEAPPGDLAARQRVKKIAVRMDPDPDLAPVVYFTVWVDLSGLQQFSPESRALFSVVKDELIQRVYDSAYDGRPHVHFLNA